MNNIIQTVIFSILIIIYISGTYPVAMDENFISLLLVLVSISLISFFVIRKEKTPALKKQYLKISTIFIFSLSIVHLQMYIDLILGNVSADERFLWINQKIVAKSLLVSSIAIVSYCLGYSVNIKKYISADNQTKINYKKLNYNFLVIIAIFLLLTFYATVDINYFFSSGQQEATGISFYFSFLFEGSICAIQIVNARNLIASNKSNISLKNYILGLKIPILLLLLFLIGVIISGDRGPIIFHSLFFIIVYLYVSNRKFKLTTILISLFLATTFITLLGVVRNLDSSSFIERIQILQETEIENRYYPNSFSNSTKELATSARALHIGVDYIENGGRRTYGLFFMQDAFLLIPSLKGTFIELVDLPKALTSSAQFLTYLDLGSFATWGVGTSCIADTYLDFGILGIILIYFGFGYLCRFLEIKTFSSGLTNFIILVVAFSIFSYAVYIPRATILYSLNKAFYISIFIYIITLVNNKKFS